MKWLQSLSACLLLMTLLLPTTSSAQELVDQLDDNYFFSPIKVNKDWLFKPSGGEVPVGIDMYKKTDGRWQFYNTIFRNNSERFGFNFDTQGDWLLVGDQQDYNEPGEIPRSLYFYQYEDTGWTYKQKITRDFSYFTSSFSIYGNWAVASDYYDYNGAVDSLYIYHLENGTWVDYQHIAYEDTSNISSGSPNFGYKVKMYGDYFVVNAPGYNDGSQSGAFYIYQRGTDNTWTKLHTIHASRVIGNGFMDYEDPIDINSNTFIFTSHGSGEQGIVYMMEFNQDSVWYKTQFEEGNSYYYGKALNLSEDKLLVTTYTSPGSFYYYHRSGDDWNFVTSYTTPSGYFGADIEYDGSQVLVSASGSVQIIGVKAPTVTSVSQGNSRSYAKINWTNNTTLGDFGFFIYRDGQKIAETSGDARSYFDYEGVPGKMHAYAVATYDPKSTWFSSPSFGYGYKQPSGIVEGKVQTPIGAGVKEVMITLEPDDINIHRALSVDSAANALSVARFNDAPDSAITVSFWLKSNLSNQGTLFDFVSETSDNAFTISNPQNITISVNNHDISTSVNVADGSWHHLAVSWRSRDGQLYVYNNGTEAFQTKFQGGTLFNVPDASISFGADHSNASGQILSNPFSGLLDELRIWNFARNDSLIAGDMYKRFIGNEKGLLSYYNFDDPQRFDIDFIPDLVWKRANHGSVVYPVFESNPTNVIHQKRETLSDAAGKFSFKNVFFDESRAFTLNAYKPDHGFSPGTISFTLDMDNPSDRDNIVVDTTSFTVGGKVYYASTDCPLAGAEIIMNGQGTGVFTKADGTYLLTVENPGNIQISASFGDSASAHSFLPTTLNMDINDNIFDADFADINTSRLYGRVGAACDNSLGVATINIISTTQCYSKTIQTDADGSYSIDLPSQPYLVTAEIADLPNLFNLIHTNLTFRDSLINFIDREPPTIRITGFPETCYDVPVVAQFDKYPLTIEVLDSHGEDSCPVDTGFITIYDAVGGDPDTPVQLRLSNGQASYILTPGDPNILDGGEHPFQKLFQVTANVDGVTSSNEQWVLVTGHRPRTQTFVTKTPELPIMMLRDPPGDESYSYLERGSAVTSSFKLSHEVSGSAGVYADVKIGAGIPVPFTGIVIGAATHIKGEIVGGAENHSGTTVTTTISQDERFSTSAENDITGEDGDVIMGVSFNMIYALTDIIAFDENTCNVVRDTQLVWGSEEVNTSYIYTVDHIRNTLLPQLRTLQKLASPDSALLFGTYIEVWEEVLENNDLLKKNATQEKNISFSAGTEHEFSTTTTQDSTISTDFTIFLDSKIKIGAVIGDGGKFANTEFGVSGRFRLSKTTTIDTTFETTTKVGYVLADNDPGDFFSVDVKHDRHYGTPVFDLVSGRSSCPFEPGSQPRDGVQLTMDSYVKNDVPLGQKAAFTLYIGNTSESDETRDYALSVIQSSNLDGAIISVGGVVIEDFLPYTIPAGEQIKATLAVDRGPLAWDYENLKLRLYSQCDPSISDTINFSVHFQSPCTDVNIFQPDDSWLVNAANNDTLAVVLNEYDHTDPDLQMITLEYRKVGGGWKPAIAVLKKDIPATYIKKSWDVSALPNGNYEIRAVARCASGLSYSPVLKGTIDRTALIVFGKPQPADGILNIDDEIRIAFTEDLSCDDISPTAVRIQDENGQNIPVELACSGKELIVTPQADLADYEGQLLTATVVSVEDINGNHLRKPYSWTFRVNQNPIFWTVSNSNNTFYKGNEPTISGTLKNAGAQDESFSLVSIPSWLSADLMSGSVPVSGSRDINFEISDALNPGTYVDTVFAQTTGGNEPFVVSITVLAQPPLWTVNRSEYTYSMNVTAQLNIQNKPSQDVFDKVAAFVGNDVRGVANVQYVSDLYGYLAFITIYSNTVQGENISFSGWDASRGTEYANVPEKFRFQDGGQLGSLSNPIILNPQGVAQNIDLDKGWTWISLNVQKSPMMPNDVLAAVEAQTGDIIKSQQQFSMYVDGGGWQGRLQNLQAGQNYQVKLSDPSGLRFIGNLVNPATQQLRLITGWNWIGYTGTHITDINEALANFNASDGDRIKSQTKFAEYDAQSGSWIGNLQYLHPGEGYKMKTSNTADLSFSKTNEITDTQSAAGAPEGWQVKPELYEYNMNLVAKIDFGTRSTLDSLDVLAAFVDDECRAVVNPVFIPALNRYQVFLTIFGADSSEKVHFKMLEHETGIVYSSGNVITFNADTTIGTIEAPSNIKATYSTDEGALPVTYRLYQNYPNPFNPLTTIRYEVPTRADVKLTIYNVLGQEVRVVVDKTQNAGRYSVNIDGRELSSGLYFYKFQANAYSKIRKMLLIK